MKKTVFVIAFYLPLLLKSYAVSAQKTDTVATYSITAYADAYYAKYTDSVGTGNFSKFPSVSPRNNSIGLNTLMLSFQYNADKIRAAASVHYGDIAKSAWSSTYNNLMEAHAGVKLLKNLWLDAGFFRTHLGTEFLLPSENITSSVSVPTFYEPYYESGFRLNFDPTSKLEINLFLLNGYSIFEDNNNKKSFGMGITYTLSDKAGIGYTNYIGDDSPQGDSVSHTRIAQNVFFNYTAKKLKLQVGGDFYMQKNSAISNPHSTAYMFSALATAKWQATKKFGLYARYEMFNDNDGFMSGVITDKDGYKTGYQLWGITAGAEVKPTENSYIKLEGRRLQMDDQQEIFNYNGEQRNYRWEVMLNIGITLDLLKGVQTKNL